MPVIFADEEEEDAFTFPDPFPRVENAVEGLKATCDKLLKLLQYCDFEVPTELAETEKVIEVALELGGLSTWVQRCVRVLESRLSVQNCLRCYQFSVQKGIPLLLESSSNFILQNFMFVYKQKEFLDLNLDQVSWFLGNNELSVDSEEVVFEAMVFWILANKKDRMILAEDLIHVVRLQICDVKFLGRLEQHFLLWDNEKFLERLRFTISDIEAGLPSFKIIVETLKRKPRLGPTSFQ